MKKIILSIVLFSVFFVMIICFPVSATQLTSLKESNTEKPAQLPPLGGGDETKRDESPVSNIELQKKFPEIVYLQGKPGTNQVALTFDDGPDPRFTEAVLDVLKENNVKATFFLMGARAFAYPNIVERIHNEGHVIGNHTYWHPNLVEVGELATLEREITQTEETLNNIIGYRTRLFRAPYGFLNERLVEGVAALNYDVIAWSVDSLDWQEQGADTITNTVMSNLDPGAIILMHDGGNWDADRTGTIQALRQIIPKIRERGLEFVTVDKLLNIPYKK